MQPHAVHLVECCHAFGLVFTEHIDVEGRPVVTWVSPMKRPAKLDYILLAKEWAGAFRTLGCPQQSVDMFSEIDHWPLLADVTLQTGVKVDHRVRIDRQALMRDKDRLGQILREVEPMLTLIHMLSICMSSLLRDWSMHSRCRRRYAVNPM